MGEHQFSAIFGNSYRIPTELVIRKMDTEKLSSSQYFRECYIACLKNWVVPLISEILTLCTKCGVLKYKLTLV